MAKLVFDYPEDFMSNLLESDFNKIAYQALKESMPTLEKSVKRECALVISDKTRHELVDSIHPWLNFIQFKNGARAWGVYFDGKPSRKSKWTRSNELKARATTNNDIAWWLEMVIDIKKLNHLSTEQQEMQQAKY